jgi:hypothetical protein
MLFYRFHDADGPTVVITNDITGANLPRGESAWIADGQTEISERGGPRLGVDPRKIIAAIEQDGIFVGSVRGPQTAMAHGPGFAPERNAAPPASPPAPRRWGKR